MVQKAGGQGHVRSTCYCTQPIFGRLHMQHGIAQKPRPNRPISQRESGEVEGGRRTEFGNTCISVNAVRQSYNIMSSLETEKSKTNMTICGTHISVDSSLASPSPRTPFLISGLCKTNHAFHSLSVPSSYLAQSCPVALRMPETNLPLVVICLHPTGLT